MAVSNLFITKLRLHKINLNYSLLQLIFWVDVLIIAAFSSSFLLKRSISNYEIGLILTSANIFSVFLQSILSSYIDRHGEEAILRSVLGLLCSILISNILMIYNLAKFPLSIAYVICYGSIYALLPLINANGMAVLKKGYKLNFPVARASGSVAYALVSLFLGFLISSYGINVLRHILSIFCILNIIVFISFHREVAKLGTNLKVKIAKNKNTYAHSVDKKESQPLEQNQIKSSEAKSLAKNSYLSFFQKYPSSFLLLISISLVLLCHTLYANFTLQIIMSINGGEKELGIVGSIAAFLELVPLILLFPLLAKRFKLRRILQVSTFFFIIKAISTFLSKNISIFYYSQIFQVAAFGLFAIAIIYYLSRLVSPEDEAKAQSLFSIAMCVGSILSSFIGGYILDHFPISILHFTCISAGSLGFVLFFISSEKLSKFEDKL